MRLFSEPKAAINKVTYSTEVQFGYQNTDWKSIWPRVDCRLPILTLKSLILNKWISGKKGREADHGYQQAILQYSVGPAVAQ